MSELDAYHYDLPDELIAQEPLPKRADARLLVVDRAAGTLTHSHVRDLPEFLRAGDLVVLNDTRVIPARLIGYRTETRGRWEGLFLDVDSQGLWRLLARSRGKMRIGETITLLNHEARDDVRLRLVERVDDGVWIVHVETDEPRLALLDRIGRVPLPPYIRHGEMLPADRERYQTVFARQPGAVAAPTAGLHFTPELLRRLEEQKIETGFVTLHVGLDTFRPITAAHLADHPMHREWGQLDAATAARINACRERGGRVVAVGTTAVRVLETAADNSPGLTAATQPTGLMQPTGAAQRNPIQAWTGLTDLFIRPPYTFQAVDSLLTNFHLPRTTLLVLVRTFGGDALLRRAYEEAVRERYRFYSYGDAMLIL